MRREEDSFGGDSFLPQAHIAEQEAVLPVYSDLLRLRAGGGGEVRGRQGRLAGAAARVQMSPVSSGGIRPGALAYPVKFGGSRCISRL